MKRIISKVHRLVAKFNKSVKGTERLIQLSGKKLVSDCPIYTTIELYILNWSWPGTAYKQ